MWVRSWSNERYDQLKAISCTPCFDSIFLPCFFGVCKSSPKKKVPANRHWWHPPGSSCATAFPWNCDDVTPCIGRRPAGESDVIRCRLVLARPFWWCLEGGQPFGIPGSNPFTLSQYLSEPCQASYCLHSPAFLPIVAAAASGTPSSSCSRRDRHSK